MCGWSVGSGAGESPFYATSAEQYRRAVSIDRSVICPVCATTAGISPHWIATRHLFFRLIDEPFQRFAPVRHGNAVDSKNDVADP